MRKLLSIIAVLLIGCSAVATSTVTLSKDEAQKSQSIAERRQQLQFDRASLQNDFQAKMNSFAKVEADLNLESSKLCFEFKKAHKLPPNTNYILDEWNGQLVKQ